LLGLIHGLIGAEKELFGGFLRQQFGCADADGRENLLFRVGAEGYFFKTGPDALGGLHRGVQVGVVEDDDEFFSAIAASDIFFPQGLNQQPAQGRQHLVSFRMSVGIVEILEMIDIQHQQG